MAVSLLRATRLTHTLAKYWIYIQGVTTKYGYVESAPAVKSLSYLSVVYTCLCQWSWCVTKLFLYRVPLMCLQRHKQKQIVTTQNPLIPQYSSVSEENRTCMLTFQQIKSFTI